MSRMPANPEIERFRVFRKLNMERKRWRAYGKCWRAADHIRHINSLYPAEQVKSGEEVLAEFRRIIRERNALPFRDIVSDYFRIGLNYKDRKFEDFVLWNEWDSTRKKLDRLVTHEIDVLLIKPKQNFFFTRRGIPMPERLGVLVRGDAQPVIISANNEKELLAEALNRYEIGLFSKPYDTCGGFCCMKILPGDTSGCLVNGQYRSWLELNDSLQGFPPLLIEQVVTQHAKISAFHMQSINTLRLWTIRDNSGRICFLDGIIRIGVGGSCTDNAKTGGVCVGLDHEGVMGDWGCCVYKIPSLIMDRHPDSGLIFKGTKIPGFQEAVELIIRAHECFFKHVFAIAWDVAVTQKGPLIIESNPHGGTATMQRMHGGWMFVYRRLQKQLLKTKSVC